MILNNFEINANFWNMNPQLVIVEEFSSLYNADKSKKKEESSKIMWGIALVFDPDSKFYNLGLKERKDIVAKDYLKNPKFKWDTYNKQIEFYQKILISPAHKQLILWDDFMRQKSEYMDELIKDKKNYSNNIDEIEKRLLSNGKLYEELNRLSNMLQKEGEEGLVKGGVSESLSEKGEI